MPNNSGMSAKKLARNNSQCNRLVTLGVVQLERTAYERSSAIRCCWKTILCAHVHVHEPLGEGRCLTKEDCNVTTLPVNVHTICHKLLYIEVGQNEFCQQPEAQSKCRGLPVKHFCCLDHQKLRQQLLQCPSQTNLAFSSRNQTEHLVTPVCTW